jgi:hypothetical protein
MAAKAPQHDAIITVGVELLGVSLLALIAGISDDVGRIVVIFMVGVAIVWGITHTSVLTTIAGKA